MIWGLMASINIERQLIQFWYAAIAIYLIFYIFYIYIFEGHFCRHIKTWRCKKKTWRWGKKGRKSVVLVIRKSVSSLYLRDV